MVLMEWLGVVGVISGISLVMAIHSALGWDDDTDPYSQM